MGNATGKRLTIFASSEHAVKKDRSTYSSCYIKNWYGTC